MVDIFAFTILQMEKNQTVNSEEIFANVLLMGTETPLPHTLQKGTLIHSTRKSETQGIFCATGTTHLPAEGQTIISDPGTRAPVLGGAK